MASDPSLSLRMTFSLRLLDHLPIFPPSPAPSHIRYTLHNPMSHPRYDLVVIGSGPAGQKAALSAAKLGKRSAIIERMPSVGGVCIHTGTIPSKAMREAVLHLTGLRERSVYGEGYAVKQQVTMDDLLYRARHVMRTEVDVIRTQMARN